MIIAIASGKGGTGKTTVSVNLAAASATDVQLLDCDVEEPNSHLFFAPVLMDERIVPTPVPSVDESLCDACGDCGRFCEFHAIVSFGAAPLVFPEMCHGCGGCMRVCPKGAITEVDRRIGIVGTMRHDRVTLIQGRLDVGVAMAPPLIRSVKSYSSDTTPVILDAPPGTSCPVVTSLRGVDVVVLVTEPTPFGLHDLKLAVELTRTLGLPQGVIINRSGIGDESVLRYCNEQDIPILMEIPDDRRIAEAYSRGDVIVDVLPEYRTLFTTLMERIVQFAPKRHANISPNET